MNKVILSGRLVRNPEVRNNQASNAVARFTIAVARKYKNNGQEEADFISCVAFSKTAEFVSKYLHQGSKIILTGRIQTGSYTNKENKKVYTTDVIVEEIEFAESKSAESQNQGGGYMNIPEDINEELPFN